MALSDAQIERYSRQIVLPEIGGRNQQVLLQSAVAISGTGPVAQTAALYCAAAGIGKIDLYGDASAAAILRSELIGLNPETSVSAFASPSDMVRAGGYDTLIEATGAARMVEVFNHAALISGVPLFASDAAGSSGWVAMFAGHEREHPCACCQRIEFRPTNSIGVEPAVAGMIGSLLAMEIIKQRLSLGRTLKGVLLRYDARTQNIREQPITKNPRCPVCLAPPSGGEA